MTRWSCLLAAAMLVAASSAAQDDPRGTGEHTVPPTFEFSFSNPGARSMGLGGAFVALADDATAAFANPAGLVQLIEPEVSVEGRSWGYSTPYVESGRLVGEAWGIGLDQPGLHTERSTEDLSDLSFLSVVYPKDRWSLAFYRHQLANFEFFGEALGLYSGPWPEVGIDLRRESVMRQLTDLEITSYAVAGGYQLTETLSIGLGVTYFDGTLSAVLESYGHACGGEGYPPCGPDPLFFFERPIVPEDLATSNSLTIDDSDLGVNAGFLWGFSERWKLGGSYRQGPELEITSELLAGPAHVAFFAGELLDQGSAEVKFPDALALGLSFRTSDGRATVGFEWDRVEYSDIVDPFRGLGIDDADELHLGGEYVLPYRTPVIALRLGVWLDPDHRIRYQGDNYLAAGLLQGGKDEVHVAAGLGLAFARMKLDLGIDVSDMVDALSLSTIYSF